MKGIGAYWSTDAIASVSISIGAPTVDRHGVSHRHITLSGASCVYLTPDEARQVARDLNDAAAAAEAST